MDAKTREIRYRKWVQVIQDWSNSGLSKRDYCQGKGIDEKQFYYYQRCIRSIIAEQGLVATDGSTETGLATIDSGEAANRPQIVKLQVSATEQGVAPVISFNVNGMNLTVPENIPTLFLAKLLEAANHAPR